MLDIVDLVVCILIVMVLLMLCMLWVRFIVGDSVGYLVVSIIGVFLKFRLVVL